MAQLKLILWKNWLLKKRKPWATAIEILGPLVLFLILAWVRKTRPAQELDASSYSAFALPSAGLVAFVQSLVCEGISDYDLKTYNASTASTLEQAGRILDQSNISLSGLINLLQNTTSELVDLNATLSSVGLESVYAGTFGNLTDALVAILNLTATIDSSGNTGIPGSQASAINQACSYYDTSQVDSVRSLVRDLFNSSYPTLGAFNLSSILDSQNPLEEVLAQYRSSPYFVNVTVPAILSSLNTTFPTSFNFTGQDVRDIQDIFANSSSLNSTEVRNQLQTRLNGTTPYSDAVITALTGRGSTGDALSALRDLLTTTTTTTLSTASLSENNATAYTSTDTTTTSFTLPTIPPDFPINTSSPQAAYNDLLNELDQLSIDFSGLQTYADAFVQIAQLPGVEALVSALQDPSTLTAGSFLTGLACPTETSNQASGNGFEQRRAVQRKAKAVTSADSILRILRDARIYYTPSTGEAYEVIKIANQTFEELDTLNAVVQCIARLSNSSSPDFSLNMFEGVSDEETLVQLSMGEDKLDSVIGGVVFQGVSSNGSLPWPNPKFSIRTHVLKTPSTALNGPFYLKDGPGGRAGTMYYYFGFVWIQDLIQRAIIALRTGADSSLPGMFVQQFPVNAFRLDGFSLVLSSVLPLFMTLSWIYSCSIIVKNIVHEKEQRLKEAMMMMGLNNWVHVVGWFITSLATLSLVVFLLTLILVGGGVTPASNPFLIFLVIEVFAIATVMLCFAISVFFSKARLAAACGGILYFLSYLPYIFVTINRDSMTRSSYMAASLSSTTAFGIASYYIANYEQIGDGLQFSNFVNSVDKCDGFSCFSAVMMMLFDAALYALIAWYVEAVWPGEFGVPRPYYFPLMQSYWFPDRVIPETKNSLFSGSGKYKLHPNDATFHVGPDAVRFFEPPPADIPRGIQIRHLVKDYDSGLCSDTTASKRAVDDLSLDMCQGHITGFLGHNGAGKSTTISILSGLFPPTSGTAFVDNKCIQTDMPAIRKSLGICPQYNVLWDTLTVREHLVFCGTLKGMSKEAMETEIKEYLADIGLTDKVDAHAQTLSGGMKRKLSVIMAFIGGSKVVILDEPTAGMDPAARRNTWDLLLKYRMSRTIMLCTHHMDEADLLSDRVAIIAKGKLQCVGSPLFLKRQFGCGYYVTLVVPRKDEHETAIVDFVAKRIPDAIIADETGQELCFTLPSHATHLFKSFFQDLETNKETLGVESFGVSATTLEEVFLKVASVLDDNAEDDENPLKHGGQEAPPMLHSPSAVELHTLKLKSPSSMEQPFGESNDWEEAYFDPSKGTHPMRHSTLSSTSVDYLIVGDNDTSSVDDSLTLDFTLPPSSSVARPSALPRASKSKTDTMQPYQGPRNNGLRLIMQQFRGLFVRRVQYAIRDRKAVISQILLPALFVCIGMAVATAFPPGKNRPPLTMDENVLRRNCGSKKSTTIPFSHDDQLKMAAQIAPFLDPGDAGVAYLDVTNDVSYLEPSGSCGAPCTYSKNMTSYLLDTAKSFKMRAAAITLEKATQPDVVLSLAQQTGTTTGLVGRAWYDNRYYHAMPATLSILYNGVYRSILNESGIGIEVVNHPLNKTNERRAEELVNSGTDLTVAINVIIALSFVPASFVLFLVNERVSRAKHLMLVSGTGPRVYWLSNFCWDLLNYLLPAAICILVFYSWDLPAYTGRNFSATCALLLLYGFSITPLMYPGCWAFDVPSTAYITLICLNLFVGLTTTCITFALELFPDDESLQATNRILNWVFICFPNYALGRGLMDLAKNEYLSQFAAVAAQFSDQEFYSYKDPFSFDIIGRNLVFMCCGGILFFFVTLLIEHFTTFTYQTPKASFEADTQELEEDVCAEAERVALAREDDPDTALLLRGLYKDYTLKGNKKKRAVNNLSLQVAKGECYGLLGVNGAGKTTTFSMLVGLERITAGEAFICGHSVQRSPLKVRQSMAYCPQFDALTDLLTGRQLLVLYCRLRGIPERHIDSCVEWALRRLQLTRWGDKISKSYSGGNKRKLSVAIALMGQADLILTDEPTAGMDPKARRFLWDTIDAIRESGRSVILTSHSMDECEALCGRISIMVNGQFTCLGSCQHLKSKYGNGYTLILKVRGTPPVTQPLQVAIQEAFNTASLKESHNGYLQYQISGHDVTLSSIFAFLEYAKHEHSVEDYSLSQTSLDEIFCNFAKNQEEDERQAAA